MLFFYYGPDYDAARAKARDLVSKFHAKYAGGSHIRLDAFNFDMATLDESLGSQGLFQSACLVDIKDAYEDKDRRAGLVERAQAMAESGNIVVWTERDPDAKLIDAVSKVAKESKQFGVKKAKPREPDTVFQFAAACAARDRKKAWTLLQELQSLGYASEEIHGTLFWQFKSIALAHEYSSAKQAGASDYAFSKAKVLAKGLPKELVTKTLGELVSMYHEAHRGRGDFEVALERFALGR